MNFMPFRNNPPMVEGAYLVRLYTGERVIAVWKNGQWWGNASDGGIGKVLPVQAWCDTFVPFGVPVAKMFIGRLDVIPYEQLDAILGRIGPQQNMPTSTQSEAPRRAPWYVRWWKGVL